MIVIDRIQVGDVFQPRNTFWHFGNWCLHTSTETVLPTLNTLPSDCCALGFRMPTLCLQKPMSWDVDNLILSGFVLCMQDWIHDAPCVLSDLKWTEVLWRKKMHNRSLRINDGHGVDEDDAGRTKEKGQGATLLRDDLN